MNRVALLTTTVKRGETIQRTNPDLLGEAVIVTPRSAARLEGARLSAVYVDADAFIAFDDPAYARTVKMLRHNLMKSKQAHWLRVLDLDEDGRITGWAPV